MDDGKEIYVYRLHHPVTGEARYVGQTANREGRLKSYLKGIGSNRHMTNWLQKLKREGHQVQMSVSFIVTDPDEADRLETAEIAALRAEIGSRCLNHAKGGRVNRGWKHSEEHKAYLREKFRGGVPQLMTEEVIRKVAESKRGIPRPEETKAKIRAKRVLQIITPESNLKRSRALTGRKVDEQAKVNISRSATLRAEEYGMEHLYTKDKNLSRSLVLKEKWASGEFRRRELTDEEKAKANLKRSKALKGKKQDPEFVRKRTHGIIYTRARNLFEEEIRAYSALMSQ